MYLKTLTLRGFKSFASSTTLRLEPGITCVVGPNGSGKSNVVDAIAWVLGEQGAKALRGGSMSDVIFGGTSGRPALGRAEVVLTIDNSDGALPIDYTEVSVSRLLYRTGESEYAINGSPCRLLDIQELLSDSGIGRELHVVVGQGQLDAVLSARPEERRAYVEEAAGVLKHRRRKEKALRKLEAMSGNLARLTDLTAELGRQLAPLGRQAEAARRAGEVQALLRDARLRLLADDLAAVGEVEDPADDDAPAGAAATPLGRQVGELEVQLERCRAAETALEEETVAAAPRLAAVQERVRRLTQVHERLGAVAGLARERERHLATAVSSPAEAAEGTDPEQLAAQAERAAGEERARAEDLAGARAALAAAEAARRAAEAELAEAERAVVEQARDAADRREAVARLNGEVAALRSRIAAGEEASSRLAAALAEAEQRAEQAEAQGAELQAQAQRHDGSEEELLARHDRAAAVLAAATEQVRRHAAAERAAAQEAAAWAARRDALTLALTRRDGAGELLAAAPAGVLGPLTALLEVDAGAEAALAAALGADVDAVAVTGPQAAARLCDHLRESQSGRVTLLLAAEGEEAPPPPAPPPAGVWALSLVRASHGLAGPLGRALAGVVVVEGLAQAHQVVAADPSLVAVTRVGEVVSRDRIVTGCQDGPSRLEVAAEADTAAREAEAAAARAQAARTALATAAEAEQAAAAAVEQALAALHDSDTHTAALTEQMAAVAAAARGARQEADRLRRARAEAAAARERDLHQLGLAEARRDAAAREAPDPALVDTAERDARAAACAAARAAETEARLAVRTAEERLAALRGRAESLRAAAARQRAARLARAEAAQRRAGAARLCAALAGAALRAGARAQDALAEATAERDHLLRRGAQREGELLAARASTRGCLAELDRLREAHHREQVARAERRSRREALLARARDEFGVAPRELVDGYGPHQPMPGDDGPVAFDRAVVQRRAAEAERQLARLGRVNPLALEEFAALQERHAFLAAQLEDLQATRRDLHAIVRDVDGRIREAFREAFQDTAREFEHVFATLFPGGQGRLELTEPDNLDTTGVEVYARPSGKKVSRLSLLSGGERSLAALALLLAIFRARPSPFYVLDEVEAALDDHNLGRLLTCLEELRGRSQLIVVTHQKRTMEIADALYGVSMRGDGISAVVSQRLRETVTA